MIDIRSLLLEQGRTIPFVHVLRLLQLYLRKRHPRRGRREIHRLIRVRPALTLDFPGTDVVEVEALEGDPEIFQVTATFLGLYGSSSPLPTFYTEDLIEEQREGRTATREFLDLINQQFYSLYFQLWEKYSLAHRLDEDYAERDYRILYSLLGLEHGAARDRFLPHHRRFLAYIGLGCMRPRSAEGLRVLVSSMLAEPRVRIRQCVEHMAVIPEHQRLELGRANCRIGEDAHLGWRARDRMGRFQVVIGPLPARRYQDLLPDREDYGLALECLRFHVDQPLEADLVLEMERKELRTCQPGVRDWGMLGWNTWLFSGECAPRAGRARPRYRGQGLNTIHQQEVGTWSS